jgi:cytoskeleton protein RodZ
LLAAGETVGASGPLPLAVTVGSVSTTDVQVRGKPFDMAPVSRDNVARFEVK